MTDHAIRSIRIAGNLNERFAAVMRFGPLGPTSLDEFELRIGEAQQIYPEIWTHLDEARAALAGRGVSTGAYDGIRAEEPRGSLGVTRVDVSNRYVGNIGDDYLKRAHFNHEGHRRATRAVKALMDAMPEVDWKGLEQEENAEIAAVGSLGPSRIKVLAILAGVGAVAGAVWYFAIRTDYEGDRADRIADYTTQADAHPCKKSVVHALAQELTWDGKPAEKGHLDLKPLPDLQTELDYGQRCRAAVADYQRSLAANPCDNAALAGLQVMLDDRDGTHDEANEYAARCKDKP